jgi:predicted molibdopterin-dependent oxidoreductase YjgC
MFERVHSGQAGNEPTVPISVDGRAVLAVEGSPLAAVLLALDGAPLRRSAVSGSPRAPFCMMGVCFECLVEVDGRADRQACLVPVRAGMCVRRGSALPPAAP